MFLAKGETGTTCRRLNDNALGERGLEPISVIFTITRIVVDEDDMQRSRHAGGLSQYVGGRSAQKAVGISDG